MKLPFRRRRGRLKGRAADRAKSKARPKPELHEVVDWPTEGTGRTSLMGAIRGDGSTGAGFGGAMFEDLANVFEGSRRVKVEEQEQQKLRRHDDRLQAGHGGRPDLSTGKIRIRRSAPGPSDGNGAAPGNPEADGATAS